MGYELFIARRYLSAKQHAGFISVIAYIAVGGVILGVAALVVMLSVLNGFSGEVKARLIGMNAHLKITRFNGEVLEDFGTVLDQIAGIDDIVSASPVIESKMVLARKSGDSDVDGVFVWGIQPESFVQVSDLGQHLYDVDRGLILGEIEGFKYPGIVLGEQLHRRLRVGLGEDVVLMTLQNHTLDDIVTGVASGIGFMPGFNPFVVTDTFESGMWQYDDGFAFIGLEDAQRILGFSPTVATHVHLKVRKLDQAVEIRRRLEKEMGYPFRFTDWTQLFPEIFEWMELEKWVGFIALSLIVVVAAFNITSILVMSILVKTAEMGILRTIGATGRGIRRIFVYQGLAIGLVGTVVGSGFGFLLCLVQRHFEVVALPGDVYWISALPVDMQPLDFAAVATLSLGTCIIASLYPARKAAQLMPVEAIRYIA